MPSGDSASPPVRNAEEAIDHTHVWFATNSGWAPPDTETLAEWAADGFSRAPDDCVVAVDGWCAHDLASWPLVLDSVDSYGRTEADVNGRTTTRSTAGTPKPNSPGHQ